MPDETKKRPQEVRVVKAKRMGEGKRNQLPSPRNAYNRVDWRNGEGVKANWRNF